MIERFQDYRVEDVKSGEQFDTTCIYHNINGGMMLAEKKGKRVVRVMKQSGDPHPNCAWGPHRVIEHLSA
jgi:hypothetical protein